MDWNLLGFVAENFRSEGLQRGTILPGIYGKTGLAAGLLQEGGAVPVVFDRDLREQQAPVAVLADDQAVTADFYGVGLDRVRS